MLKYFFNVNSKLIKKNKFFYKRKTKNVWGIDLQPEFPKTSYKSNK